MEKSIVILGGSFNPPTKAHIELLESAVKQLNAEFGLFVPSSHNYVKRKMSKAKEYNSVYSESTRFKMLQEICKKHPLLKVSKIEFGDDGKGHTYNTLCKLQSLYPNYKLIFVIGADKLKIIPKWHSSEDFFKQFDFAVTHRDDIDMNQFITEHPVLSKYKNIFHEVIIDNSMNEVSSTAAREYINTKNIEKLKEILDETTIKLL